MSTLRAFLRLFERDPYRRQYRQEWRAVRRSTEFRNRRRPQKPKAGRWRA